MNSASDVTASIDLSNGKPIARLSGYFAFFKPQNDIASSHGALLIDKTINGKTKMSAIIQFQLHKAESYHYDRFSCGYLHIGRRINTITVIVTDHYK